MSVHLSGSVPVTVVYDPTTKTVERVIVHDDGHEWTDGASTDADGATLDAAAVVAYQAAADDAEWPGWTFGW